MPHRQEALQPTTEAPQLTVAYLGPVGTYSEEAAQNYFAGQDTRLTPYDSLDHVAMAVTGGEARFGVLPIENSTGGTVHRTLDLLLENDLSISGEVYLPIRHQLLTRATQLGDIHTVGAHPQALAQCRGWLSEHAPHATQSAAASNAAAARIAQSDPHYAAIASAQASKRYGVPILAHNIEDETTNTTRFLVVGGQSTVPTGKDKTSIVCGMPHVTGALHNVLGALAKHGVNLTKIESRPITSKPWEYMFFIDMEGHAQDATVSAVLEELHHKTSSIRILGSYATGATSS